MTPDQDMAIDMLRDSRGVSSVLPLEAHQGQYAVLTHDSEVLRLDADGVVYDAEGNVVGVEEF